MASTTRRMHSLHNHLKSASPPVKIASGALTAEDEARTLLNDEQMKHFISAGYVIIKVDDITPELHETVYQKTKKLYRVEDGGGVDFGNNIFPAVPELGSVFKSPKISGALQSLLGNNYAMHPHRHMHSRPLGDSGRTDQGFHMDSYWGMTRMRHHVPRWCMCLYYPHEVTLESGPTGIMPYSQYWEMVPPTSPEAAKKTEGLNSDDLLVRDAAIDAVCKAIDPSLSGMPVVVPAGSAIIMAYDLYHRGCRRRDEVADWRAMYKFQFFTTEDRFSPTWDHDPTVDSSFAGRGTPEQQIVWEAVWDYMSGRVEPTAPLPVGLPATAAMAGQQLRTGEIEAARMGAAYTLGRMARGGDAAALSVLVDTLNAEQGEQVKPIGQQWQDGSRRAAMYGLGQSGQGAVAPLLRLATTHGSTTIRIAAVHALSEATATPTASLVDALLTMLPSVEADIESPASDTHSNGGGENQPKLLHSTLMQTLGNVGMRAAKLDDTALVDRIVRDGLLPAMLEAEPGSEKDGADNGGTPGNQSRSMTRQNATQQLLSLSTAIGSPALSEELAAGFATCTEDTDRYVMGYSYEGIRRMSAAAVAGFSEAEAPAELAAQRLLDKVVYERWCPHTGAGLSSF